VTFHSSRNAANEALKVVADVKLNAENHPDIYLEAARVHAELAKAEAVHDLATQLGNIASAIGGLRR
jgi:hypothetical protein